MCAELDGSVDRHWNARHHARHQYMMHSILGDLTIETGAASQDVAASKRENNHLRGPLMASTFNVRTSVTIILSTTYIRRHAICDIRKIVYAVQLNALLH